MVSAVLKELEGATGLKTKSNELPTDYARRLAIKVNNFEGDAWEALSEPAQVWVNSALEAIERSRTVTLPGTAAATETSSTPLAAPAKAKKAGKVVEAVPADEPELELEAPAPKKATKKAAGKAVKAPSAEKAAPAPKKAAKASTKPEGEVKVSDTAKIRVLVEGNPHRVGSIRDQSFKAISDGMTVAEAVANGARRQQIWSMATRGVISLSE